MAKKQTASGKKPLTKEQMQAMAKRKARMERNAMLSERRAAALSNSREYARIKAGYRDDDYDYGYNSGRPANPYADRPLSEVDHRFATDVQKMKFCRKPVGFIMNLIFLVAVVLVAFSFIPLDMNIPMVGQFTALFTESEPKVEEVLPEDGAEGDEGVEGDEGTEGEETPENAGEEDTEGAEGEGTEGTEGEGAEGEGTTTTEDDATYYTFSDPVYGWISYIAKLFGMDLSIGESAWYDNQIAKVETGMNDGFAAILIQAFPAAIIVYVICALVLMIKTFICWASGDRRIFRRTGIDCLIMIIMALVVALGGFASTVDIGGSLEFGGIVDFLLGGVMGTGGFTAGFGLLIMIVLPVIGLILSFFLLEKKLRSREITQPIIMYEYRESMSEASSRRKKNK